PNTVDGRLLLAHELAHAVQDGGADGQARLREGEVRLAPDDAREGAARRLAGHPETAPTLVPSPPGPARVHRLVTGAPVLEPSAPAPAMDGRPKPPVAAEEPLPAAADTGEAAPEAQPEAAAVTGSEAATPPPPEEGAAPTAEGAPAAVGGAAPEPDAAGAPAA